MNNRMAICSCGFPLISTMVFAYAEYYCLNCGRNYGMMDVDRVEATVKLKRQLKKAKKIFGQYSHRLALGGGVHYRDCKKCSNESHSAHCTQKEKDDYKKAKENIKKWRGKIT